MNFFVGEDDAAEAAALAVDVLGRRIDDDVGAEFERLLEERRREHVVDDQPRAGLVGDLGDRRDVDHFERRVGRAFEEEHLRVRPHRLLATASRSLPSTSVEVDAVSRQQLLDHVAAGAEQRPGRDDMVAGLEVAEEGRRSPRPCRVAVARAALGAFEQRTCAPRTSSTVGLAKRE